jgi:tetratricopeptide (TPR) repeat protein
MGGTLLLAAAVLAHTPVVVAANREPDRVDVAYTELSEGRNQEAIERINENDSLRSDDPARLINLGTAHARLGQIEMARTMFEAALHSDRFELELADGSWVDSKVAATSALERLDNGTQLALAD